MADEGKLLVNKASVMLPLDVPLRLKGKKSSPPGTFMRTCTCPVLLSLPQLRCRLQGVWHRAQWLELDTTTGYLHAYGCRT